MNPCGGPSAMEALDGAPCTGYCLSMVLYTKGRFISVVVCLGLALAGCQSARVSPTAGEIRISNDIMLHPVAAGVWVHTIFSDVPGYGRVPANGLVVIDGKEAMLIDHTRRLCQEETSKTGD